MPSVQPTAVSCRASGTGYDGAKADRLVRRRPFLPARDRHRGVHEQEDSGGTQQAGGHEPTSVPMKRIASGVYVPTPRSTWRTARLS
jgi:hypothetical protein